MGGKPCIRDMRVTMGMIARQIGAGCGVDDMPKKATGKKKVRELDAGLARTMARQADNFDYTAVLNALVSASLERAV